VGDEGARNVKINKENKNKIANFITENNIKKLEKFKNSVS